jgi:hypothetical protein
VPAPARSDRWEVTQEGRADHDENAPRATLGSGQVSCQERDLASKLRAELAEESLGRRHRTSARSDGAGPGDAPVGVGG